MGGFFTRFFSNNNDQDQEDYPRNKKRGNIKVEYVSKKELYAISPNKNAIRAGSTHDPDRRKYGYQSDGYVGTMYCAKVTNMEKEEDKLLRSKDFKCNIHKKSNAQPIEGYVYVIQGKCNC